jgi:1-acyl-sn-glycerol-3-phosphate acyltransferase
MIDTTTKKRRRRRKKKIKDVFFSSLPSFLRGLRHSPNVVYFDLEASIVMTGSISEVLLSKPVISARMMLRELAQILFFALFVRPLMAIFIGYRTRGRQWLPGAGPFVLIANHSSHLDTVSLLNLFPLRRLRDIQPVAAADYFERNRFVAWFSHIFFNILPIDRLRITPENNPIQRMLAQLRAGKSLIIYPEGTRGSGDEIGPIRPGIAHLLEQMPRLPVTPVYLVNHGKCLPKGEWFPVPFFCEIRIGPPQIISGGNRRESLEKLKSALFSLKNASRFICESDISASSAKQTPSSSTHPGRLESLSRVARRGL